MTDCDECGFVYDEEQAELAGSAILETAMRLAEMLERHASVAAVRPDRGGWSPLEYGCHVRDVLTVQRERALHARRAEKPTVVPMGREERAEHDGYLDQDPVDVANQVVNAARLLSNVFARLETTGWDRTLIYNYPTPAERSLRWLAIHTRHEVVHHLGDIEGRLA